MSSSDNSGKKSSKNNVLRLFCQGVYNENEGPINKQESLACIHVYSHCRASGWV
jgi:hypothetical protein